jgi:hypothetical protein
VIVSDYARVVFSPIAVDQDGNAQRLLGQRVGMVADDAVHVGLSEFGPPGAGTGVRFGVGGVVAAGSARGGVDGTPQAARVPVRPSVPTSAAHRPNSRREMSFMTAFPLPPLSKPVIDRQ